MTEERKTQVAYIIAVNNILTLKIPPVHEFQKFCTDKARDLGIQQEEFAEFYHFAYQRATDVIEKEAGKIIQPKKKTFGFS